MSPDMMASGDSPYRKDKFLEQTNLKSASPNDNKSKFTGQDLQQVKSDEKETENLSTPHVKGDKSDLNNSNGSNPYSAETQPYSEPEPTVDCKNEASYSMSSYLPQSTDKESSSAPIFVTASSQGDSEKASTAHSNLVAIIPKATEDHLVMKTKENTTSRMHGEEGSQCDQNLQSQESSQDNLNLYLTLESQMSVALSLPLGGEKDQFLPPGEDGNLEDLVQNEEGKKDIANSISNDVGDQTILAKEDDCDTSTLYSNIPHIRESTSHSPINENESGFSIGATTFASEENLEIRNSKSQSDIVMDTNDTAQNLKGVDCPESKAHLEQKNPAEEPRSHNFVGDLLAVKEKLIGSHTLQNKNTIGIQTDAVQPLMMYDENSNSNDANHGTEEKILGDEAEVMKESPLLSQSVDPNVTSKDASSEVNPSMQSTYVNEPAKSLGMDVPPIFPSQDTWTDSGSTSKGISDSPYMDSSDFSMDYSLLDKDRIEDLETQPFTASSKSGLKRAQNDQCQTGTITATPQSGNGGSKADVTEIIKDIVTSIINCVVENKEKGAHRSCNSNNTASTFANPNLSRGKDKQPVSAKSIHGGKPMESEDLFEDRQNEQDKSSDTIAMDGNSDCEVEKESPPKTGYVYRVTRSETVDTLLNGEVIETKVLPRKIKYLKKYPAKAFTQSSGGSGYLADTSSLSRSSSNCSAKTHLTDSPAFGVPETNLPLEPVRRNELGTSSNSDSSQNLISQQHSLTQVLDKSKESSHSSSPQRSNGALPKKGPSPMVVLTPLSTQQLAIHHADATDREYVATPPSDINPPISGSTPVDFKHKNDTSSDVTSSNSPEFGYLGEPMTATSVTLVDCCQPSTSAAGKMRKGPEDAAADGIPVMARPPSEGYFYPGMMHHQDPMSGKCTVIFHADKMMSEIRESDVLLIDQLNAGQEVRVLDEDTDFYLPGTIISHCHINNESGYLVEVASSSDSTPFSKKDVAIKRTSLTGEQKRSFVQPINNVPSSSDVSLDNVVDGKRKSRRLTRGCDTIKTTSSPIVGKVQRSLRKRRLDTSASLQIGETKKAKLVYKKSTGCPIQHPSNVTKATVNNRTLMEDVAVKIKAGGGHIAKDFTELSVIRCERTFVISDTYCRTMNYLKALATGTECVSYRWILDSMDIAQLLPMANYVLPAGYSLQQLKVVERLKIQFWPLQGLKVFLRLKDHALWRPLLSLAGCDVITYRKDEGNVSPESFDVIVADSSTFPAVLKSTKFSGTSVVSVEWIVQCLINSEKLPFDAHEQYGFQHSAC